MKYKILDNKEWLENLYIGKGYSLSQIGKKVGNGATHCNVRWALVKHGILIRSKGDGRRRLSNDYFIFNKSVIAGCLLGDGGLKCQNKKSNNSYACFFKRNKYFDHVEFVAGLLFENNANDRIIQCKDEMFLLQTLTHKELKDLFERWYPSWNNYKKVIPNDLKIDKTVLLHWFLDDGYSYYYNRKGNNKNYKYLRVQFATQCFSKDDLEMLSSKVYKKFGIKVTPRFHQRKGKIKGTCYHLELSQSDNQKFYEIIGQPPVPNLAYKWKNI